MRLETERLQLKPYVMENLEDYYRLKTCEKVWVYSTNQPEKDKNVVREALTGLTGDSETTPNGRNCYGFHALFEKKSGVYIGEAGILSVISRVNRCEIGYNLLPNYWSQGYATEIAQALTNYAFDQTGMERVEALAMVDNKASCRVLEKSGLKLEGILKHFTRLDGKYLDVAYYGIIREEYKA